MSKFKKSMVIIPIAFTSVLSVAAVTSCSGVRVDYEKAKRISGVTFREEKEFDYIRSINRAGILKNTSDLVALYGAARPYSKDLYERFLPGSSETVIASTEKEQIDRIKKLQEIKDRKLPRVPENRELLYFISRGPKENFVDSVLLTEDKKLIINFIDRAAIRGSRVFNDLEDLTNVTFMTIPKSNYLGIQINTIRTMAEFKRYKKDTPFSSYVRETARPQGF